MVNLAQEASEKSDEIDLKIFDILVEWIKKNNRDRAPITYSDLVKQVNTYSVIPVNVGMRLGRVSNFSREHNFPPISAIVGGLEFSEPGKGFFEALGLEGLSSDERLGKWVQLLNEVYNVPVENWEDLAEEYQEYITELGNDK